MVIVLFSRPYKTPYSKFVQQVSTNIGLHPLGSSPHNDSHSAAACAWRVWVIKASCLPLIFMPQSPSPPPWGDLCSGGRSQTSALASDAIGLGDHWLWSTRPTVDKVLRTSSNHRAFVCICNANVAHRMSKGTLKAMWGNSFQNLTKNENKFNQANSGMYLTAYGTKLHTSYSKQLIVYRGDYLLEVFAYSFTPLPKMVHTLRLRGHNCGGHDIVYLCNAVLPKRIE